MGDFQLAGQQIFLVFSFVESMPSHFFAFVVSSPEFYIAFNAISNILVLDHESGSRTGTSLLIVGRTSLIRSVCQI